MSKTTPRTVDVARPVTADKGAWMDLWAQYNAFYGRKGETALPQVVVDTTWRRILDPESSVDGLIASVSGKLVGLAHVAFHDNLIQLQQTCYMQDLFTAPDARGLGVARALIDGVAQLCRSRRVSDVYWHTQAENTVALRLYDQICRDTNFVVYRMSVK